MTRVSMRVARRSSAGCAQDDPQFSPSWSSGLGFDAGGEISDLVVQAAPFTDELTDLAISVHHRRVIAPTEGLADLRQAQIGEFAAQVHRDLPGGDEDSRAGRPA